MLAKRMFQVNVVNNKIKVVSPRRRSNRKMRENGTEKPELQDTEKTEKAGGFRQVCPVRSIKPKSSPAAEKR